jgi:hypothetical protein
MLRLDCHGLRAQGSVTIGGHGGDSGDVQLRKIVYGGTELDRAEVDWSPTALKAHLGTGTVDLAPLTESGDDGGGGQAEAQPLDLDIKIEQLRRVSFDSDSWLENVRGTVVRKQGAWQLVDLRGELPKALWSSAAAGGQAQKIVVLQVSPAGPGWRVDGSAADFGSLLRASTSPTTFAAACSRLQAALIETTAVPCSDRTSR